MKFLKAFNAFDKNIFIFTLYHWVQNKRYFVLNRLASLLLQHEKGIMISYVGNVISI